MRGLSGSYASATENPAPRSSSIRRPWVRSDAKFCRMRTSKPRYWAHVRSCGHLSDCSNAMTACVISFSYSAYCRSAESAKTRFCKVHLHLCYRPFRAAIAVFNFHPCSDFLERSAHVKKMPQSKLFVGVGASPRCVSLPASLSLCPCRSLLSINSIIINLQHSFNSSQ